METFGTLIRNAREKHKWKLRELAAKLDLDTALLSKFERDIRTIQPGRLVDLSNILKIPLEELEIEYIKSDIRLRYSYIDNYSEKLNQAIERFKDENTVSNILQQGENKIAEFKSSLRYCLTNKRQEKHIEFMVVKTICAFLNTNGGNLLIGVDDNGEILGLENTDFTTFKDSNKKDSFLKHFDNLISNYFGNDYNKFIDIELKKIKAKTIAVIEVKPNQIKPTIIKNLETNKDEFYIRRNASTVALSMEEFFEYCKEQW